MEGLSQIPNNAPDVQVTGMTVHELRLARVR